MRAGEHPAKRFVLADKIDPQVLKARLEERDKRLAADNRDLTARLLGDPVRS